MIPNNTFFKPVIQLEMGAMTLVTFISISLVTLLLQLISVRSSNVFTHKGATKIVMGKVRPSLLGVRCIIYTILVNYEFIRYWLPQTVSHFLGLLSKAVPFGLL